MSLVRNISDISKYVRLSYVGNDFVVPDLDALQILLLTPVLGKDLLDKLETEYATLSNETTETAYGSIFVCAQRYLAQIGMAKNLATIQTLITDSGIRTMASNNTDAAHSWEFKSLRDNLFNSSAESMEVLIQKLFFLKAELTEWTDSTEYKKLNSLLIKNATEFNNQYRLYDPFRTYFLLVPILEDVQKRYLFSLIGSKLATAIIAADSVKYSVNGVDFDIKETAQKAVALLTIKEALIQFSTQFVSGGFTVLASGDGEEDQVKGRSEASYAIREKLRSHLEVEGQNWLRDLVSYLKKARELELLSTEVKNAYDAGPLAAVESQTVTLESKNADSKIFRF